MVVVRGETLKSLNAWGVTSCPNGTKWTYREKAGMCDILGEEWFEGVFSENCGPERFQLLIVDGHSSHETIDLLECARENNIHILSLPPHATAQ